MFIFNGISSDDMEVILEENDDLLGKASQKFSQIDINGSNETVFDELGYTVIEKTIKLSILNIKKLDMIFSWLNGLGILEFNNRVTNARFYNEINPKRMASIKTLEIPFIRDPFWLKKDDDYVKAKDSIFNYGNIYSEPLIKLVKKISNKIDLTINGVRFNYDFKGEEYVEIDCKTQDVKYDGLRRDRQIEIDYNFPRLNVGENKVSLNSGDAEIFFKRKDRWL